MKRSPHVTGAFVITVISLSVLCVLAVRTDAGPPASNPPSSQPTRNTVPFVSVEERLAMGVDEPTWVKEHGKIQPEVRKALSEEKTFDETPDKELYAILFKPMRPVGHLGMVYVAVHLKCKPQTPKEEQQVAIRDVQDTVLSRLTAAEFSTSLRFKDRPILLGFVNERGLDKLTGDRDVTAVGLDAAPFPLLTPQFFHDHSKAAGDDHSKIDPQVREAFSTKNTECVDVIVMLKQDETRGGSLRESTRAARQVQDEVLSKLNAKEFQSTVRTTSGSVYGRVNADGAKKLETLSQVVRVGLPEEPVGPQQQKGTHP